MYSITFTTDFILSIWQESVCILFASVENFEYVLFFWIFFYLKLPQPVYFNTSAIQSVFLLFLFLTYIFFFCSVIFCIFFLFLLELTFHQFVNNQSTMNQFYVSLFLLSPFYEYFFACIADESSTKSKVKCRPVYWHSGNIFLFFYFW